MDSEKHPVEDSEKPTDSHTEDTAVSKSANTLTESTTESVNQPTFKTPSFVISTKKKVKAGAEDVFKAPAPSLAKSVLKAGEKSSGKDEVTETSDIVDKAAEPDKSKDEKAKHEKTSEKLSSTTSKEQNVLSPAEQLKSGLPYQEPAWSADCEDAYSFEVIKNGAVIDTIDLTSRCFHVVGRLPSCNIAMEHPSLSRHHAIIQYSGGNSEEFSKGWYLFDLDSTHGTWINKNKVPPKKFHRLHVDYVMKFGGSTRYKQLFVTDLTHELLPR